MAGYLLWDVDGTLLLNSAQASRLYDRAIEEVTGFRPDTPGPGEHGKTDGQIIAERLAQYDLDPEWHGAIGARLDELSTDLYLSGDAGRKIAPGVHEALAAVRDAGWTNTLLTGNSPTRARVKLVSAGLDAADFDWEHSFFGHRTRARREITENAVASLGDEPRVIVGDTPSDGQAADAARIPFVAVATGAFGAEVLRETSALVVLDDLVSGQDALLAVLSRLETAAVD
ncbi:HAD family hydrolase [Amnibacterium flavum]|uniref:Phosphatase n=1 Tax=Amnibacterium flavum TaxID=2173173 RepID=A0A2V1HND0_9MICO|nr:HAD family hydrolase [Amnibacterium flavum]PVZ94106.1 hypothetical protein DDQ50_10165 [Amnibacterium flavum]